MDQSLSSNCSLAFVHKFKYRYFAVMNPFTEDAVALTKFACIDGQLFSLPQSIEGTITRAIRLEELDEAEYETYIAFESLKEVDSQNYVVYKSKLSKGCPP